MIIRCAWCKKIKGEKEPLDDKSITDGLCDECLKKYYPEIYQRKINERNIISKDDKQNQLST